MDNIVITIIVCVIIAQACFFGWNLYRMFVFKNIFSHTDTYMLTRNSETDFVNGISGVGNKVFQSIVDSINKYLGSNTGSVIDFGLLKDAVDRHCDAVEEDIATQTPIPLYLGLAGTMAGIILGLGPMVQHETIVDLLNQSTSSVDADTASEVSQQMGEDINSLLSGVKWAMVASICGIILTTINSFLFKVFKLKEESGKNTFLAWMQSRLLPELPSDTAQALNNLVKNLNSFNRTFANNTASLGQALKQVNESYAIQGKIIQAVHDMDVMKMAKANVRVLQELKECTDKLEEFNQYLTDIEGYTAAIHRFEVQFHAEADRIHVLEEIKDFFNRHKGSMSTIIANEDDALRQALSELNNSSTQGVTELKNRLVEQSDAFKAMMAEEKKAFEDFAVQMQTQFKAQLSSMPRLASDLERIAEIPARLDKLIERMEKSNRSLEDSVRRTMSSAADAMAKGKEFSTSETEQASQKPTLLKPWMQWTVVGGVAAIAIVLVWDFIEQRVDFSPIISFFSF